MEMVPWGDRGQFLNSLMSVNVNSISRKNVSTLPMSVNQRHVDTNRHTFSSLFTRFILGLVKI